MTESFSQPPIPEDKPQPDPGFFTGIRNGILLAIPLWILIIWGINEMFFDKTD